MRTFRLLFLTGVILQAAPVVITTVITSQQYQSAILGGADPAIFLAAFEGIAAGTPFSNFSLTPQGSNWVVSAVVDLPDLPPVMQPPPVTLPPPVTPPPVTPPPLTPPPVTPLPVTPPEDEGGPSGGGGELPHNGGSSVPEIDPGVGLNALGLLTGGLLVLRGRKVKATKSNG